MRMREEGVAAYQENVGWGLLGAVLGTLPGCILWVIVAAFGFLSAVCAVLIIVGAQYGYRRLAKAISRKGRVLCGLTAAVMLFAAVNLSYLLLAVSQLGISDAAELGFLNILYIIWHAEAVQSALFTDLALSYIFLAAGVVWLLIVQRKRRKTGERS